MASNLLEKLGKTNVPPPPATFDRDVHHRVNHALVVLHVVDFGLRSLPYALVHFARALGGLVKYTVSGRYDSELSRYKRPE